MSFYEAKLFEFNEEKFNESLVLANQDIPTTSAIEIIKWKKAIEYVARAYWAHYIEASKAFYYFKKIYEQGGFPWDYVYYGLCYFYGFGVEEDVQKACEILKETSDCLKNYTGFSTWSYQMYQMVWYYAHYYEIKQELTQTKEKLEARLEQTKNGWIEYIEKYQSKCKEYSTLEAQLSQTKKEWSDKYNQLVNEYNTLLNKSKSACLTLAAENQSLRTDVSASSDAKSEMASKYNQLVSRYNKLCDQYERLVAENARNAALAAQAVQTVQSSQSNQSDRVKVKICYGYVDDKGYKSNNWVKRIEMPKDEYKALLNGSMKAREAYVKNKWLSSRQQAVNVTIALDE